MGLLGRCNGMMGDWRMGIERAVEWLLAGGWCMRIGEQPLRWESMAMPHASCLMSHEWRRGTPVSMLQNCAGFAVFAFIFEGMNPPPQPAVAAELNLLGLSPPHAHCSSSSSSSGGSEQQCELHTGDLCSVSCSYPSSSACSGSLSISAGSAAADAPLCSSVSSRARRQVAGKVRHGNSNGSCPVVYSPQCQQQHLLTVLPLSLSLPLAAQIASSAYHF
ncbi:unnamed protein product [Closterium sp. NIES-53]